MQVSLFFVGDEDGDELSRLGQLLSEDQNFASATVVVKEATDTRGDKGSRRHLIQIIYERPSILEPLARVLGTWAETCSRNVKIQIRAGTKEIEIDGAQPMTADEAATRLVGELGVHS